MKGDFDSEIILFYFLWKARNLKVTFFCEEASNTMAKPQKWVQPWYENSWVYHGYGLKLGPTMVPKIEKIPWLPLKTSHSHGIANKMVDFASQNLPFSRKNHTFHQIESFC